MDPNITVKHELVILGAAILTWLREQSNKLGPSQPVPLHGVCDGTGLSQDDIVSNGRHLTSPPKLVLLDGDWATGRVLITSAGLQSLADYESIYGPLALPMEWRNLAYEFNTDGKKVFYGQSPIPGAMLPTFEALNHLWSRDAKSVFSQTNRVRTQRNAFRALNDIFATDGQYVFHGSSPAKSIDAPTFRVLDAGSFINPEWGAKYVYCGYACDKDNAFFYDFMMGKPRLVRGADPASLRTIRYTFATDERLVFCEEKRLPNADPTSFEVLSRYYSKDKEHAYFLNRIIPDADVDTFHIIPTSEPRPTSTRARDRHSEFKLDKRV